MSNGQWQDEMIRSLKGLQNCVRVLKDVNGKEKMVKSKILEIDIVERYILLGMGKV